MGQTDLAFARSRYYFGNVGLNRARSDSGCCALLAHSFDDEEHSVSLSNRSANEQAKGKRHDACHWCQVAVPKQIGPEHKGNESPDPSEVNNAKTHYRFSFGLPILPAILASAAFRCQNGFSGPHEAAKTRPKLFMACVMDNEPASPTSRPAKWCFVTLLAIAIACVLLAIAALSTAHNSTGVVLMISAGVSTVIALAAFSFWDPKN
jgi:hypothetical protein